MKGPETIDAYIAGFPEDVQAILQKVRATIRKAAPGADEAIRYAIPTFTLNGNLVHFAAFRNHIGFYPAPSAIAKFRKELSAYEGAKGSVRFPLDEPIPYALIRDIVKFRVGENSGKGAKVTGEKILTRHPQGKTGRSIDKAKYDKVAKAIRSAAPVVPGPFASYQLVGLPAFERDPPPTQVNVRDRLNHTDLYLPVVGRDRVCRRAAAKAVRISEDGPAVLEWLLPPRILLKLAEG